MNVKNIRANSLSVAVTLGYTTNPSLPLLDQPLGLRRKDPVIDRLFAMQAVAVCAYGYDCESAQMWLSRAIQTDLLTTDEAQFLSGEMQPRPTYLDQIEGMWALAWAISSVAVLDFSLTCSDDFVRMLPSVRRNEKADLFRRNATLRNVEDVVAACDLAYCLHWSIRECQIKHMPVPGNVPPYVVIERRRALEWLISDIPWEEISLDT